MANRVIVWGVAGLMLLATKGALVADDPTIDVPANSPVTPAGTPATRAGSTSDQLPSDNNGSGNGNGNSLSPDTTQSSNYSFQPGNSATPTSPLLPQQPANYFAPFTSSPTTQNAQSPQLTSPNLYTTGTTDVSQIATTSGLMQAFSGSTSGFASSEQEGGYSHPPIERIRLGPVDMKAAVVGTIVSDDNIRANGSSTTGEQGGSKGDIIYNVTPALLFVYGEHEGQRGYASLVYAPTISRYFHNSSQNSDNQNVALNLQYPFQRLTLNATESYSQVTGINLDSNTRTTQTSNLSTFGGNYEIDDKFSLSSQISEAITSYSNPGGQGNNSDSNVGQGDETTSWNNSLYYHYSDKLSFGPSLNVGVDKQKNGPQQIFEQGSLGAGYQPTEKINFSMQAGVELRQSDGGNVNGFSQTNDNEVNPIFSVGVGYTPFDSTSFNLNAAQAVRSSDINTGQTVVTTSVGFSATQRFFQRLFLNGVFNYNHNEGQGAVGSSDTATFDNGTQDNITYRTSLSIAPNAWTTASVYYQYSDNESDNSIGSYHDNQFGLALSAQF